LGKVVVGEKGKLPHVRGDMKKAAGAFSSLREVYRTPQRTRGEKTARTKAMNGAASIYSKRRAFADDLEIRGGGKLGGK